ncbi:MAG: hypothetical protein IT435_19695 [Phycisphaerales bacterium]|nr:hypothetical protein [Phycisphaerales bacterium]
MWKPGIGGVGMRPLAVCLLASLLAGGCTQISGHHQVPISGIESPITGPLAVDIQSIRGAVLVETDPKLTGPSVMVAALEGGKTGTAESFIASQLAGGEHGSVLRVVSADTADGPAPRTLITVRVPACDGLRVRTSDGDVRMLGVGGAIDVEVGACKAGHGGIVLDTTRALNQPVSLMLAEGRIDVRIPSSSELTATADAMDGLSKLRADSTRVVTRKLTQSQFEVTIGSGTAPMVLRTGRGDIILGVHDAGR